MACLLARVVGAAPARWSCPRQPARAQARRRLAELPPLPLHADDPSLRWEQPGTHLALLIAAGEGRTVEFKRQVPMADRASRKTVLKTVAAFASSIEGGTILFGVDDDGQVVGVDPATLDAQQVALVSMVRDNVEPEPRYQLRTEQLDGRVALLLEVTGSGRPHALFPARPEFYVRRGASTM